MPPTLEIRSDCAAVLTVEGLTVDRGATRVVDGVSFHAGAGEIVGIVGPNGAGKTTLLEALLGLRPARGRVTFGGDALDSFRARAAVFAYMPDEASLPEEASVDTVLCAAHADPARRAREAHRFGIEPFLHRGARSLSRGEAKRVWLAATALRSRPVLVLDEPFGAFDPLQLDALLPAVKELLGEDGLALVTVHQLSVAERLADRIVILARGRVLAEGTLDQLRAEAGVQGGSLEAIFRALLEEETCRVAT